MKKVAFQLVFLFIILVFLQVWLFGNIHLFGFATPLLYIYFLIKLPVNMNRSIVLTLSVLLGFVIDIFSGTLGLCMTVMTITGFLRSYLLKLFAPREILDDSMPSFSSFGTFLFLRYAGTVTLTYAFLLYSIESFSLFNPLALFLRIISSFALTILLIFAFESVNFDVFKK
jgi:rod shape-determining protein MreD